MKKFCNLLLSVSFFLFLISCDYHISKEKIPDIIADAQKGDQEALYLLCHYCGLKQPQLDSLKTVYGDKYPEVRILHFENTKPEKKIRKEFGEWLYFFHYTKIYFQERTGSLLYTLTRYPGDSFYAGIFGVGKWFSPLYILPILIILIGIFASFLNKNIESKLCSDTNRKSLKNIIALFYLYGLAVLICIESSVPRLSGYGRLFPVYGGSWITVILGYIFYSTIIYILIVCLSDENKGKGLIRFIMTSILCFCAYYTAYALSYIFLLILVVLFILSILFPAFFGKSLAGVTVIIKDQFGNITKGIIQEGLMGEKSIDTEDGKKIEL